MKTSFKLIALFFVVLSFTQCTKEEGETVTASQEGSKIGSVALTNDDLAYVPYTNGQQLVFKNALGNTQTYQVANVSTGNPRVYENGGTDSSTDYYDLESRFILLQSSDYYDRSITIQLQSSPPSSFLSSSTGRAGFRLSFSAPGQESFYYDVDMDGFYFSGQNNLLPNFPSYSILGNTYNNVFLFSSTSAISPVSPVEVYYNNVQGLVGFKNSNGELWYLQ